MLLNKFDKFIDENDRMLSIDTSTRNTTAHSSPKSESGRCESGFPQTPDPIVHSSPLAAGSRSYQHQLTPQGSTSDHPLKQRENTMRTGRSGSFSPSAHPPGINLMSSKIKNKTRSSHLPKRRSLIQPILTPTTPDAYNSSMNSSNSAFSMPTQPRHERSSSNVLDFEYSQFSVHSRTSSSSSIKHNLDTSDINTLLKTLATKELDLFESKQKIEDLKKQLAYQEKLYKEHARELELLKQRVSRAVSENTSIANDYSAPSVANEIPMKHSPPPVSNIISPTLRGIPETDYSYVYTSPNDSSAMFSSRRTSPSVSNHEQEIEMREQQIDPESQNPREKNQPTWKRPLALFSRFDRILQNEIEKSLHWDDDDNIDNESVNTISNPSSASRRRDNSYLPNVTNRSGSQTPVPPTPSGTNTPGSRLTAASNVSKSLWNLVSDIKSGLLGSTENVSTIEPESEREAAYNKLNGDVMPTTTMGIKPRGNRLEFIGDDHRENSMLSLNNRKMKNVELKEFC